MKKWQTMAWALCALMVGSHVQAGFITGPGIPVPGGYTVPGQTQTIVETWAVHGATPFVAARIDGLTDNTFLVVGIRDPVAGGVGANSPASQLADMFGFPGLFLGAAAPPQLHVDNTEPFGTQYYRDAVNWELLSAYAGRPWFLEDGNIVVFPLPTLVTLFPGSPTLDLSQPFLADFAVFRGPSWTAAAPAIQSWDPAATRGGAVPAPPTVIALALGLLGLGTWRLRRPA